jgi:uncharacterized protein with GYD domain
MAARKTQRTVSAPSATQPTKRMKYYLVQFSYTPEAWADLLGDPNKRDRIEAVKPIVNRLGGCFPEIVFPCEYPPYTQEGKWAAFGDHDVVALLGFPGDQEAAAFAMIVSQGQGVKSFKTTPLLSWSDAKAAMDLAAKNSQGYIAPGGARSRR